MSSGLLLYQYVVTLGVGAGGFADVSRKRADIQTWLGSTLAGEDCTPIGGRSRYLEYDDLVDDTPSLADILSRAGIDDIEGRAALCLDLSDNDFTYLREPVLLEIAKVVGAWTSRHDLRLAIVMVPALPSESHSALWPELRERVRRGRAFVVANDGRVRSTPGTDSVSLPSGFAKTYADLQAAQRGPLELRIGSRTLRRLGHFKIVERSRTWCGRYFYDASLAVDDIARVLADRISQSLPANRTPRLLTHGSRSAWLHEAAMAAAAQLGGAQTAITDRTDYRGVVMDGESGVLVFDVIGTGTTAREVMSRAREQHIDILPTAYSVLIDGACESEPGGDLGIKLDPIHTVTSGKIERGDCVQCRLELPWTEPEDMEPLQLRAFDAWELLLSKPWVPEEFPKDEPKLLDAHPHMGAILEEFGDWIAYKIERILNYYEMGTEPVVVAPDESNASKLIDRMSARYDGRLVAVRIPRQRIGSSVRSDGTEETWEVQLRHLARAQARSVVILDEMNASGRTAATLVRMLKDRAVFPRLYVPIIDRSPKPRIEGVRCEPLYAVQSPR